MYQCLFINDFNSCGFDKIHRTGLVEFAIQEGISGWVQLIMQGRIKTDFSEEKKSIKNRYYLDYLGKNFRNLEKKIADYGVDFRNQFNKTPLHISVIWGVLPLIQTLKTQGAGVSGRDTFGLIKRIKNSLKWRKDPLRILFFISFFLTI